MPDALGNLRIDQLPQNSAIPAVGYIAMRNMTTGLTERVEIHTLIQEEVTQNFEWVSDNDPGYDEDEVVTYEGSWWQSLQDNNLNIPPGSDPAYWLEVPKSSSGLVFWVAGIFPQDQAFVLYRINGTIWLFELDEAEARPFVSSDFLAELAAGKWKYFGLPEYVSVDVSSDFELDFSEAYAAKFFGSVEITGDREITFSNDTKSREMHLRFSIDQGRVFTLPASVKMQGGGTYTWDGDDMSVLDGGEYELVGTQRNGVWYLDLNGPFN